MIRRWLLAAVVAATGCKAKPLDTPEACPSWKEDIAALVVARCTTCHGGDDPAGGYDLSSYATAIDRDSLGRLSAVLTASDAIHSSLTDALPTLSRWAGECQVAYLGSSIHGRGILDPTSSDFHGAVVEAAGWRLGDCARCHGADYTGGAAKVACTTCHAGGPTACTTCHGNPPATDGHKAHLAIGVACTECHTVPATYDAPGHPPPAGQLVTFGSFANKGGNAAYSTTSRTCSGVYCHGGTFADSAAGNIQPNWGGGPTEATCGTCHGLPPSTHGSDAPCAMCHQRVVDADNHFITASLHINGEQEIGDGTGTCTSCHGNSQNPLGGAHAGHTTGTRLRGPLACGECHTVPAAVDSPGHIDDPLPADIVFGALAKTDSAAATYTAATQTCSAVYCHGGGTALGADTWPGLFRTPVWSGSADQATCGTCHGIPPTTGTHLPTQTLADCVGCHSETVDGFGNIKVAGDTSTHMNGAIDVD